MGDSDSEKGFDLAAQYDEPMNRFCVVHVHNKASIYHLTRQVLLDSTLTQNAYCLFRHIITKSEQEFNENYGSFACLLARSDYEADLYLNVDQHAFDFVVHYIQTGKIDRRVFLEDSHRSINEIIDLATMIGIPTLVKLMRDNLALTLETEPNLMYAISSEQSQ